MTVEQVAAYLQLHKLTVYKFIRSGELQALRLGRCSPAIRWSGSFVGLTDLRVLAVTYNEKISLEPGAPVGGRPAGAFRLAIYAPGIHARLSRGAAGAGQPRGAARGRAAATPVLWAGRSPDHPLPEVAARGGPWRPGVLAHLQPAGAHPDRPAARQYTPPGRHGLPYRPGRGQRHRDLLRAAPVLPCGLWLHGLLLPRPGHAELLAGDCPDPHLCRLDSALSRGGDDDPRRGARVADGLGPALAPRAAGRRPRHQRDGVVDALCAQQHAGGYPAGLRAYGASQGTARAPHRPPARVAQRVAARHYVGRAEYSRGVERRGPHGDGLLLAGDGVAALSGGARPRLQRGHGGAALPGARDGGREPAGGRGVRRGRSAHPVRVGD